MSNGVVEHFILARLCLLDLVRVETSLKADKIDAGGCLSNALIRASRRRYAIHACNYLTPPE